MTLRMKIFYGLLLKQGGGVLCKRKTKKQFPQLSLMLDSKISKLYRFMIHISFGEFLAHNNNTQLISMPVFFQLKLKAITIQFCFVIIFKRVFIVYYSLLLIDCTLNLKAESSQGSSISRHPLPGFQRASSHLMTIMMIMVISK